MDLVGHDNLETGVIGEGGIDGEGAEGNIHNGNEDE